MPKIQDSILFFDSGSGGLTVLNECRRKIKGYPFFYYGDNQRAPYGNLSEAEIQRRVFSLFRDFALLRPRAVVLACNTVTAVCAEKLRERYSFPIIGAEPAVYPAARVGGEVFVLSTRATHESERFKMLCARARAGNPRACIHSFACDLLAGEIQKQLPKTSLDLSALLPTGKPDSVVLGCTHYVFMKEQISKFYGCPTYDGNEGIANVLARILSIATTRNHAPCESEVFFLGEASEANKSIFEQMFVIK